MGDKASIAKVFLNKSICLFKFKRYSEAENAMWHSLDGEYITADNNSVLFSQAQYIWGNLISVFLDAYELQHINERKPSTHDSEIKNMLDKGIEAFLTCIQLYSKRIHDIHDTDDSCERYFSFIRLSNLYQKKEQQYHDGCWVLARYYAKEAKQSLPKQSEFRDFLGQSRKEIFLEDEN